jgi:hypothetical protein
VNKSGEQQLRSYGKEKAEGDNHHPSAWHFQVRVSASRNAAATAAIIVVSATTAATTATGFKAKGSRRGGLPQIDIVRVNLNQNNGPPILTTATTHTGCIPNIDI